MLQIGKHYLEISSSCKNSPASSISLIAVDTAKVAEVVMEVHGLWISVLMCFVSMALLIYYLGVLALTGVGTIFILSIIPLVVTKNLIKYRKRLLTDSDKRIKYITEIFQSIKVIKVYCWETKFIKTLLDIRNTEMKSIDKILSMRRMAALTYVTIAPITQLITYMSLALYKGQLEPIHVYSTLLLFTTLRVILNYIPFCITSIMECKLSLQRITNFLKLPKVPVRFDYIYSQDIAIFADDATFSWDSTAKPCLTGMTFQIPSGALVAVTGNVGGGKSSFLNCIMGQMHLMSGILKTKKTSFGYVPQQAWILGGTVRENILFGKSYDHNLYTETVKICALNRDLETFPNGDQTIIGDNGATLSGGQKQRINIARAVYSQSEILLMDDPLSALDTRISQYLFDACFMTYSKTKTKLLVTNQMHLLHQTDYIIVIDHGCVIQQGEFNLLMHQDGMFQGMMSSFNHISNIDQSNEQVKIIPNRRFSYLTNPIATNQHKQQSKPKLINDNMLRPTMIQLIQSYLTICGWKNAAIWFILLLLQNASLFISDRWLVAWSGHKLGLSQATYIYTYSVLIVIVIVVNMMGLAKAIKLSSSTATVIHNNTVEMLFKAQSSYYDTIAIGKIIDRFSKEQSVVDLLLAFGLNNSTYLFINFLCFICLMAVYNSMFAIVVPFVLLGFYKLQKYYRRSSREIKRLDTQSRAPVLSIFSTIMNGSTMIQAFDQQQTFMQKLFLQTDIINRVNFVSQCSVRWLGQYADVLG